MILNQMKVLDEQIAATRPVDQQRLDVGQRLRIDLPALRGARRPAAAAPATILLRL
jgi:hypothetical protein